MMDPSALLPALRRFVTRRHPTALRHGFAMLLFVMALGGTLLLRPWIVPSPFPLFFAATMVAACTGGLGPGLTSTALGSAAVLHFFLPSLFDDGGAIRVSTLVRFGSFFGVSLLISGLGAALRSALHGAEATLDALRRVERERTTLLASEQAARADAEAARSRFAFLAEASTLLDASLDYPTTLASVACLAVPHIGQWCIIDTCEGDDDVIMGSAPPCIRLTVAHADPARRSEARNLQLRYPPRGNDVQGALQVMRTGQSEFVPAVSEAWLAAFARDAEHLSLLRALGCRSYMCVPIAARGRILGAITFVRGDETRTYDETDLALAEDLAHRAAMAIDTARLYHKAQTAAGG
jgi:hypothetical protein